MLLYCHTSYKLMERSLTCTSSIFIKSVVAQKNFNIGMVITWTIIGVQKKLRLKLYQTLSPPSSN